MAGQVRLARFRGRDLSEVVRLYNELVAGTPCNWPVSEAEFADEVMGSGRLANVDLPFDPAGLLVASVAGAAAGFVHFHTLEECGLIRFLTFPEGRSDVGTALLEEAVNHLCRAGCTRIEAWRMEHGYPFYTSMHGGCWEQSHVANLFLANGFETFHREVVFHRSLDFGCEGPASVDGWPVEKSAERFGHEVLHRYTIADGGVEAARVSWHRMSALSRHPTARDHGYINQVGTAASHRRQGLGMTLMREMLIDMRQAGLREATLHTMFDNTPAIGLYTRAAFRYVGTNIILRTSCAHRGTPHHGRTNMRTVRYEEMLPHETVAARTAKPVAYLPLGILEWHGEHCAVGLDGVKAHELCIRAARRGGGVCMPVQFWGEDRETNVHDRNFDPKGKLADAMGLPHGFMAPGHMNGHVVSYQLLLHHMLYQIKSLGFNVIFMLYGHYPLVYDAQPVAKEFMEANPGMRVYAGMESDPIRDAFPESEHEEFLRPFHDKHAGKWETSILKTLRPELVDLSQIPPEPGSTIVSIIDPECDIDVAEDPRCDDLDEYGAKITAKVIEAMNIICDRLLAELQEAAPG